MGKKLHITQEKLLKLLKENLDEELTISKLQDILGLSTHSLVLHHINQLEKKGYIKRNPHNPQDFQILADSPKKQVTYLNVYTLAAHCGRGESIIDGNPIDRIPVSTRLIGFPASEAFMVRAKGDSMIPTIKDNDYVIVQKTPLDQVKDGNVVVSIIDGQCQIKEIQFQNETVLLVSHNRENYKTRVIKRDEIQIEGIVRGTFSNKI